IHNLQVWEHPTDSRRDEVFVPKPLGSAILVFNRSDDGNVKPKLVIQGPATKLEDNDGVTGDDKEIAVPNRDNSILGFPRLGNGNIAPLRQITWRVARTRRREHGSAHGAKGRASNSAPPSGSIVKVPAIPATTRSWSGPGIR